MKTILFFLLVIAGSTIMALFEIQIEGKAGWAANLPTWKISNKFMTKVMGNRPVTGYHIYLILFTIFLLHVPFLIDLVPFTFKSEMRVLSFWLLFINIEDFLWFVLNPDWGIKKFKKEYIWWHAESWWIFMPKELWIYVPLGIVIYILSL